MNVKENKELKENEIMFDCGMNRQLGTLFVGSLELFNKINVYDHSANRIINLPAGKVLSLDDYRNDILESLEEDLKEAIKEEFAEEEVEKIRKEIETIRKLKLSASPKFIIRDREAGNVITWFDTRAEAEEELRKFEETDKKEGTYSENFYEIVEEVE